MSVLIDRPRNSNGQNGRVLLDVKKLTKDFGGLRAVDRCSFGVDAGSVTSLIGPNGAGKTTVFNLITGLLKPTAGNVRFDGKELTILQPHAITRLGISRTFQITRDLLEMTVLENMAVHSPTSSILDLFKSSILQRERKRAMELLDYFEIAHLAEEKAKNLSYGQKKLLEIASVLMSDPHLVLLDEPTGGVNPVLMEKIVARILELNRDGITFFVVEHNMDVVMSLSASIIVMAHGQILLQDTPEVVQSDQTVLDAYLGAA